MTKVKVFAAVLAVIICGSLVVVQAFETQATKGSTSKKASAGKASVAARASGAQRGPQVKVDSKLAKYSLGDGVSGAIKSEGSDTMVKLMQYWTESFQRYYPNVQVEVQGKGSATAPTALIAGTSNFGPMSREMKSKEIDEFEARFGYKPTGLKTGIDMLAVYVHKDNPIKGLTLPQVDAIFSKNRKGGYEKDIRTWGDLGLKGQWANKPISLYGRNSASGTYGYFKENALFDGDYKDSVQERPGSSAVVQGVARNKFAIGYSGIGYKTADVRPVPLAREEGEDFWRAEADYVDEYPLSRFLFVYVNYEPRSELEPLRREFIKYIFSREGQEDVVKDDYLPVGAKTAFDALSSVGITVSQ